jgi:hypothetical protein
MDLFMGPFMDLPMDLSPSVDFKYIMCFARTDLFMDLSPSVDFKYLTYIMCFVHVLCSYDLPSIYLCL